ncbi:hypothetical protein SERLA73DRAFT_181158 [Serpula lacrymans var. lacrymans S7.3]|uniref:Uncharacterized protein n=2 Tax=Serpula lacrymans var. lacrymans TaxID=341189 RepID=F8PXK1_SERL3|nr:uncharacterized protein SERLADRAFT_467079 [Serpula lacrymans var. lacrymans S7.9]EGN98614.1 hypothetical protein SERLA73DRAFT_181158 [Serpula lacrymans var. lacrymans S7.3]EGO24181.1 hypothetical protein SERLADRAFT_467079 [Serpula lacrymans var. lacrymans S7.9]
MPVIGICDWEFVGDIAQLGSYLNLPTLSPLVTPRTRLAVDAFSVSLYAAYFSSTKHLPQGDVKNSNFMQVRSEFQRPFLSGWELINVAAWRHDIWCPCPGNGVKCPRIVDMVQQGALLIRAAGAIMEDVGWKILEDVAWVTFLRVVLESEQDCPGKWMSYVPESNSM